MTALQRLMTHDEALDDVTRARIWSTIEDRLADDVAPAPRPRRLAITAGIAVAALAAALVALLVRPTTRDDANVLAVPGGARVGYQLGPHARTALVGPARLEVVGQPGDATTVRLRSGTLLADFTGGPGRALRIETRAAVVEVVGTLFAVEVHGDVTCTAVSHGRVRVSVRGRAAVLVGAGERFCTDAARMQPITPALEELLARHATMLAADDARATEAATADGTQPEPAPVPATATATASSRAVLAPATSPNAAPATATATAPSRAAPLPATSSKAVPATATVPSRAAPLPATSSKAAPAPATATAGPSPRAAPLPATSPNAAPATTTATATASSRAVPLPATSSKPVPATTTATTTASSRAVPLPAMSSKAAPAPATATATASSRAVPLPATSSKPVPATTTATTTASSRAAPLPATSSKAAPATATAAASSRAVPLPATSSRPVPATTTATASARAVPLPATSSKAAPATATAAASSRAVPPPHASSQVTTATAPLPVTSSRAAPAPATATAAPHAATRGASATTRLERETARSQREPASVAPTSRAAPVPSPVETPEQRYRRAEAALAARDLAGADRLLASIDEDSALAEQARYERARIAYQRRAWDAARQHLDRLLATSAGALAEPAHYLRCRIAVERKESGAAACFRRYRARFPHAAHDLDAVAVLAQDAYARGGCAAAAAYIGELAAAYPRTSVAASWRSRCGGAR